MIFFLYLGQFFTNAAGDYCNRLYSHNSDKLSDYLINVIATGIIAMGFFYVLSGFSFMFNFRTVLYALFFGVAIIFSRILTLLRLRLMEIIQITLISDPLSLIVTFIAGWLFFGESINWISGIRLLLSLIAAVITLFCKSPTKKQNKKSHSIFCLILTVLIVILGVFTSALQKAFALDPNATDSNSMFFLTNVFTVAICLLWLLLLHKGKMSQLLGDFKTLGIKKYSAIILSTLTSNLGSVLTIQALAIVPLSIHTPVAGAIGKLSTTAVSYFVKEKVPVFPVILALISTLLAFFEL